MSLKKYKKYPNTIHSWYISDNYVKMKVSVNLLNKY